LQIGSIGRLNNIADNAAQGDNAQEIILCS
jgi:hypothetical protein